MPETTPTSRPAEGYLPSSIPPGGTGAVARSAMRTPATSLDIDEASDLLVRGLQLLHEFRAGEAEPLLLRALELYERQGNVPAECVQVHCELASIATTRADFTAAESHLQRALTLANVCLTSDHPDVATILGGLARLYLRRSEFTKAEPLLQRLLDLKRARGDEHPEVATVMASLATAHSAMGAHESAERILRRVLAIREKTLAPNHFATVTTLEHLAESCAARGKLEEALTLLHRALAHRQRALGLSHPSISAARARIADLELLSSNEELGAARALAVTLGELPQFEVPSDGPVDSDEPPAKEPVYVSAAPARVVAHELPEERQDEFHEAEWKSRVLGQLGTKAALVTAFARTPRGRVTVLTVGVTSLLAALVLAVQTRAEVLDVPVNRLTVASKSASPVGARGDKGVALKPSSPAQPPTAQARPARQPTTATTNERRSVRSAPVEAVDQDSDPIQLPTAPRVTALELPLPGTTVTSVPGPAVALDFPSSSGPVPAPAVSRGAISPAGAGFVHAVLPAGNPAPEYPPDLLRRRVEGRVMAEFLVDATGRVDSRTLRIISSTDEQFTQAVRAVLPKLRFLPAESAGARTEEWVAMPFRFSPKAQ